MRSVIAGAFFTQGLVFISLTTRLPRVQEHWGLGELGLSALLLLMVLVSGAGSLAAEHLAPRSDSATILRVGLALIAVALPLLALAPHLAVFVCGVALYGLAVGVVDAGSNMQAVALEHELRRVVLPSCHGAWTLGAVVGAALTLLTSHASWTWVAAIAAVPLVAASRRYIPGDQGTAATTTDTDVPWRPIALVGLALVVFYMVDTAAAAWGPIYLERVVDAPQRLVALAVFPYFLASGLVRLVGDQLTERVGAVPLLRGGAVVAALALGVVVLAPSWPIAVVGFTLLGGSVAVVAPLSFSAAAALAGRDVDPERRRRRVDAVIARFNQFNYAGALVGAVLTGIVGQDDLRWGFAVPTVLVLALLPLARAFAPVDAMRRSARA